MSAVIPQDEACAMLACSPNTLHAMLAEGVVPGIKPGKEWVIPREAFVAAINQLAVKESALRRTKSAPAPVAPPEKKKPGRRPASQLSGIGY